MARMKRTAQAPGRPSPFLDPSRSGGEPVTRLRRTTRWRAHVLSATWHRTSARIEVGHWQGEPEPWPTEAGSRRAAYERGRRGTGVTPGPGRAQAARVDVSFRRAPCPMR